MDAEPGDSWGQLAAVRKAIVRLKIEAILGPAEFEGLERRDLGDAGCVVFDVLRATSTMVAALENGARSVRPAKEIAEALAWKAREPEVLLGGEREGRRILANLTGSIDFDLGNSPREYTAERVGGRAIVMTTTNGTRALAACARAAAVYPATFANLEATMEFVVRNPPKRLILVCAGTVEDVAYEDVLAAGAACAWRAARGGEVELGDAATLAWRSWQSAEGDLLGAMRFSRNARRLLAQEEFAGDVAYCLRRNVSRVVAEMRDGAAQAIRGGGAGQK
jgi:2-phosphosulfolactate phosphatase